MVDNGSNDVSAKMHRPAGLSHTHLDHYFCDLVIQASCMRSSVHISTTGKILQKVSLGMPGSQPSIIQRLLPVDSFDMTIYADNGKILWNKTNQPVIAGRGTERVCIC